ncbi:ParB/RepB/Spo0J family partition protein [Devosia sp. MC521]|uniref:ParB/RepB/Spo0J family partition protein n=1 Tax=Devosia sp. MC521 TaxID=2759954 RepID=UPI0015FC3B1E|nr:ParB/RepB/Spo0J family partition protein [Devosia sp. MC521]MBJ6988864.1 ParB-like nuclease domain-containing protein [Devosia sp. MC521]QMW63676.1 ParB N-terminal domain-containing protein [Devosia sp. MC521]
MSAKAERRTYDSIGSAIETLEKTLAAYPQPPQPPVHGLRVSEIIVCETLFQRRDQWANKLGREEHIRELKRAIKDDPTGMEPIDVWWGGDGWYLVDGHHRHQAYERLSFTGRVPVRVVSGSLNAALAHVGLSNTRNKLPMNNAERMTLAVFYVCLMPEKSLREIAKISGVGKTQVAKIRKAVDQLVSEGHRRMSLADESWESIRRQCNNFEPGERDYDLETRMKANDIKEALKPVLGRTPHFQTEAMIMALMELSPQLWRSISDIAIHRHEAEDDIDEEDLEY